MLAPEPYEAQRAKVSSEVSSRLEVADILRRFGPSYAQTHTVSPFEQRIMDNLTACRTASLGGHLEHCTQCGFERQAYNSCRNRHCPKCQTVTKMRWLEARRAELLPTAYFHTVFTLPHEVNPLVLANKRHLLGLLFQSASETLLDFGKRRLQGQLGAIMILHTWDQRLHPHFHVHALVPGGALADQGQRWNPTKSTYLFPVKALSTVFRAKYRDGLKRLYDEQALRFTPDTDHLERPEAFQYFVQHVCQKKWVVYAKAPFGSAERTLDYLGRYTHRVAIANSRLVAMDEHGVAFRWKDYRASGKTRHKTMTLGADEFMRRFLLHVLPGGFHRIRHYGLLANGSRKANLARVRELLHAVPAVHSHTPDSAAEIEHAKPCFVCLHCGAAMLVLQTFARGETIRAPPQQPHAP